MTELVHEQLEDSETPQSPMEALRAKRQEIADRTEVLIPLAGYEEMGLHIKYRLIGRDEADKIAKNVRGQTKDRNEFMYRVIVDTMIAACEGFFLKDDGVDDDHAVPLQNEAKTGAIKTFGEFAQELNGGEPIPTVRLGVLFVFGDNEFAVGGHGLLLNRWLSNTGLEIDQEFLEG